MQPLVRSESAASVAAKDSANEVDRRAHHNALERRRRHHIKDSFATLRALLPMAIEPRASRASILNATAAYIRSLNVMIDSLKTETYTMGTRILELEALIEQAEKGSPKAVENLAAFIAKNFGQVKAVGPETDQAKLNQRPCNYAIRE